MPPKAVHLVVRGRVQGVGFRAWTQHQGQLRGLRGWVRNRRDGSVEAVVAGPAEAVDLMVEACRAGPMTARVEAVEASPVDPAEAGEGGFEQRATA